MRETKVSCIINYAYKKGNIIVQLVELLHQTYFLICAYLQSMIKKGKKIDKFCIISTSDRLSFFMILTECSSYIAQYRQYMVKYRRITAYFNENSYGGFL